MKQFILIVALMALFFALIPLPASADTQTATLSATAPTENTDGSSITDFEGVNVYYGTEAGNYTTGPLAFPFPPPTGGAAWTADISHEIPAGTSVTYYYVITAYSSAGLESEYSAMGSKTFFGPDLIPNAPTDFAIDGVLVNNSGAPVL